MPDRGGEAAQMAAGRPGPDTGGAPPRAQRNSRTPLFPTPSLLCQGTLSDEVVSKVLKSVEDAPLVEHTTQAWARAGRGGLVFGSAPHRCRLRPIASPEWPQH